VKKKKKKESKKKHWQPTIDDLTESFTDAVMIAKELEMTQEQFNKASDEAWQKFEKKKEKKKN
jgi:hypothetical protein